MSVGDNEFSNRVLARTLEAVRGRRRRKHLVAGVATAAVCVAVLLAIAPWGEPAAAPIAEAPAPRTGGGGAAPPGPAPALTVFRTEDVAPRVKPIDDAELAELLAGRPFGLTTTADGRRQLWVPES